MILSLLSLAFAAQSAPAAAPPPAATTPPPSGPKLPQTTADRYEQCIDKATGSDPKVGEKDAAAWLQSGGQYFARQCLGVSYTNQGRWQAAAQEFEGAANDAEVAHDKRSARYWAQAGNAWLAAGDAAKARSALDAALGAGTLEGQDRGEAAFDHARALVALGNLDPARADMDIALKYAANDPLIWLSSATLARKMGDLPLAKHDIIIAYKLAADDPSVNLEIGNIAAASGDLEGARMAWEDASRTGKNTPIGQVARAALKQLDSDTKPAGGKPK
ncbi:MAG: hypothetical protein WC816_05305 [Sphingomonas sp.]|jgi:tetratricopeptide (TPR) repeat protein